MNKSMAERDIEMGKGHFRGHPIWWDEQNEIWRYSDNNEPIPGGGGEVRPCKKCGQKEWSGDGAVDACLGTLPGVTNACCGHGVPSHAYVCFEGGVVLRGFTVDVPSGGHNERP